VIHKRFAPEDFSGINHAPILGMHNSLVDGIPQFWPEYSRNDTVARLISPSSLDEAQ